MELDELDDLLPGLGIEPTNTQLDQLYAAFVTDFVNNQVVIDGLRIKVIQHLSKVVGFTSFPETFVHLITRKSTGGKRVFDRHRANKIHWIKCILENKHNEDISYFQYPEQDGTLRDYFWHKEGNFLVIMQKVTPDYLIVTSFHVDNIKNKEFFQKKYKWYLDSKK